MDNTHQPTPETTPPVPVPSRAGSWLLIRLLAYCAVILLVVAMLLPSVRSSREAARRNNCLGHLAQIALALSNYESVHGAYPPAYTVDAEGRPLHSWRTLILPHMEQQALYDQIDLTKPWDDPANEHARNTSLSIYQCPSNPDDDPERANFTTYLAVVTPDSVIRTAGSLSHAELPAPSETLLVIDAAPSQATHWMSPVDANEQLLLILDPNLERQHSIGIWLAAHADSRVSALSGMIDPNALRAMITATADDNDALQDND